MRRAIVFSTVTMFVTGGCVLLEKYDYSGYGGQGSAGSGESSSSSNSSSSSVSSSGTGGGGGQAQGGAGGNGGGGSGGLMQCAEICNYMDPPCYGDVDCNVAASEQNGFGDIYHQQVRAIATTLDNTLLIAGDYAGSPTFGSAPTLNPPAATQFSGFVANVDSIAQGLNAFTTIAYGNTLGVGAVPGGAYTIGVDRAVTVAQFAVRRFTLTGGITWQHDFGAYKDKSNAFILSIGNDLDPIYVAGTMVGTLPSGSSICPTFVDPSNTTSNANPFVFELDKDSGVCNWGFTLGGGEITGMSLIDGQLVIVGHYKLADTIRLTPLEPPIGPNASAGFIAAYRLSSDPLTPPTVEWVHTYAATDATGSFFPLAITADGQRTYLTGTLVGTLALTDPGQTMSASATNADMVVMAFDSSSGARQWAHRIGGLGHQVPQSILKTTKGLLVAGYHVNTQPMASIGMAIVPDQDQGLLCAGKERCLFLMKWNDDGTTAWAREFGVNETAKDPTVRLAVDTNSLWLAASREAAIDFKTDGVDLMSAGGQDVLVARFVLNALP